MQIQYLLKLSEYESSFCTKMVLWLIGCLGLLVARKQYVGAKDNYVDPRSRRIGADAEARSTCSSGKALKLLKLFSD